MKTYHLLIPIIVLYGTLLTVAVAEAINKWDQWDPFNKGFMIFFAVWMTIVMPGTFLLYLKYKGRGQ